MTHRIRTADDEVRWAKVYGDGVADSAQGPMGLETQVADATVPTRNADRAARLGRLQCLSREIDQAIVRAHDPHTLFHEACRIAVEHGGFRVAWIGHLDAVTGELRVVAGAVAGEGYAPGPYAPSGPETAGLDLMATALRETRPAILTDVGPDPALAPWPSSGPEPEGHAWAVLPFVPAGRDKQGIGLCSGEPGHFGDVEMQLLHPICAHLSLAARLLDRQQRSPGAESVRAEIGSPSAGAFENAAIGMALVAETGQLLKVNGALCALLRRTEQELQGLTLREITHPDDPPVDLGFGDGRVTAQQAPSRMERRCVLQSGELIRALLSVSLVRDALDRPLQWLVQIQDVTPLMRLEDAHRHSQERFRMLADSLPGGTVSTFDRDLRLTFIAGSDPRRTGVTSDMLLGRHFRSLVPGETWAIAEPRLRAALQGRTGVYEAPHHDDRLCLVTLSPLQAADGTVVEVLVVAQDVTEHTRSTEALRESDRLTRLFAMATNDALWNWDLTTGSVERSIGFERLFGYAHATIEPSIEWWIDRVHAEDRAAVMSAFETARAAGRESCSYQYRFRRKDLGHAIVLDRVYFVRDGTGRAIRCLGAMTDISELKQAEDLIRIAHQRLSFHVQNSPLALVEWDSEFRVQLWSGQAETLFGWRSEEVAGKAPTEWGFIHSDDLTAVESIMRRLLEGRDKRSLSRNRNCTKDGRIVHCEWYNSGLVGPDGRLVSILSLALDVTDRKHAEDGLLQSQQQLRALSGHLQTLREEERTRISREIHDELGQMLTGIKMDLRWLEHALEGLETDRRVNTMIDKVVATAELTDATIRTVQRIAAELRPGVLDRLGLPTALGYEAARFAERTGITCRLAIPDDTSPLPQEAATALFRTFQEALTNVARHAQATTVEVEFHRAPGRCRLEVRDDGRGITGTDMAKPTSLGLLGMRERARLLGGDVRIGPRAGGGTEVCVDLPLAATAGESV